MKEEKTMDAAELESELRGDVSDLLDTMAEEVLDAAGITGEAKGDGFSKREDGTMVLRANGRSFVVRVSVTEEIGG